MSPESPIGFIGLGIMGGAIATRMIGQGKSLIAYDADPQALGRICSLGAQPAGSPREVADRAATILACLPSPAVSRDVALGPAGVIHGAALRSYIELSTIGTAVAAELSDTLARQDITMLDAPVSGGANAALAGRLATLVSGPIAAIEGAVDLMHTYSGSIHRAGRKAGDAQLCKLINNAICIFSMMITFESLSTAKSAGIDLHEMTSVINESSGRTFTSTTIIPNTILSDPPAEIGKMAILLKDLELYLEEGLEIGVRTEIAHRLIAVARRVQTSPDQDVAQAMSEYFLTSA